MFRQNHRHLQSSSMTGVSNNPDRGYQFNSQMNDGGQQFACPESSFCRRD